ncbi:MAG: hypothetical protein A3C30_04560 [Candidatus Levybacteria bacterium RIFCSPHIGHO2_02_FULL_40_18]|nr:MAG: hypothetical protein A2869_02215 [Candidatus Levybacteria bacterium RIFCSPHIGHO2_01_FULL_40_58]OGH26352.1 MAG: hypothetical protein A3C30_04560 [Candidatus Levybacteria bacterium RIFCSPHIGHO2_02_FULL_40_18]OGH31799.1 MAG: hypothetical protein A3E43_00355 [Candidatus Levybacteria bacterium RIFCSPHIGHO2_12_FULL_40_31]OGH40432.1 MAG: hypothetical protein A2894_00860 [Candidatus Levybacteria bacterium RIFCSPLOWO2_01_FULL_40_64]OGH49142.1 MAG: hypothetical protein A3I54_04255 [Candidatus Lev
MGSSLITNQKEKIRELIDSSESIGIIVSENQNIDTVAAALGLYLSLSSNGKNVQIVSKKEPTVEVSSLVGVDKISKTFAGNIKILTISVPYREGEIEKVSYNIEDTRLNVNLFAETSGITFNESEIQYIRKGSAPSLVITLGVIDESELLGLLDLKSVKSIHIDRNPLNAMQGDVVIIDPSFSSLSEIVTELITELNLGHDIDSFQNLMDGITYATRNFTLPATSPFAFEMAGFLLQNGARRKEKGERREERERNFPQESHFLQTRGAGRSDFRQNRPQAGRPQTAQDPFASTKNIEQVESVEGTGTGEIPEDWFLPKVFKGSRKGN